MTTLKKLWKFLSSMQFALLLLGILAAACALASFITQGLSFEQYAGLYGERAAALILALHLDDAFHSVWFVVMAVFLLGNLMLCNLIRLPALLARTRAHADPEKAVSTPGEFTVEGVKEPEALFRKLGFASVKSGTLPDGRAWRFAAQHTAGLWGAWVCHLGIFLLILGFGLGQATYEEHTVYGVAGQTRRLGETPLFVTIEAFVTTYRGAEEEAVE
ncbi:MAG: cytochrome c biogenesis protein ResB, partial [bacterium]